VTDIDFFIIHKAPIVLTPHRSRSSVSLIDDATDKPSTAARFLGEELERIDIVRGTMAVASLEDRPPVAIAFFGLPTPKECPYEPSSHHLRGSFGYPAQRQVHQE
jgi:hypothetical protein